MKPLKPTPPPTPVVGTGEPVDANKFKEYVLDYTLNPLVIVKESKKVLEALQEILGERVRIIKGTQKALNIFKELYFEEFDRSKGLSDRDTVVIDQFEYYPSQEEKRAKKKLYNSIMKAPRVVKWPSKLVDCPREFTVTSRVILVAVDLAQMKRMGV